MNHDSLHAVRPRADQLNSDQQGSGSELRDTVGAFVPGKIAEWKATGSGALNQRTCGVKDVFDIAGSSTGYGNPKWESTHQQALADAHAVAQLRSEGACIVGKTVTDELAFSLAGNNVHYGSPLNTAAPDRMTGGSSCGSAAAVAAGLCDIGLGTDTAGSVRAPAAFCGLVGLRSTHGAVSREGVRGLAPSFDAVGWLARDAQTLAAVGQALLPRDMPPTPLSGWLSFDSAWSKLPASTGRASELLFEKLQPTLGARQRLETDLSELDEYSAAFRTMQFYEVWNELGPWLQRTQPVLGPDVRERFMLASKVSQDAYRSAGKVRAHVSDWVHRLLEDGRVIVMPTVSAPGPLRTSSLAELNSQRQADLRLLCVASLAGVPQVSLPLLSAEGAPFGLSLLGPAGSDKSLLALASELEGQHSFNI